MHLPEEPAHQPHVAGIKIDLFPPRLLTPSTNRKRPAFLAIAPISLRGLTCRGRLVMETAYRPGSPCSAGGATSTGSFSDALVPLERDIHVLHLCALAIAEIR